MAISYVQESYVNQNANVSSLTLNLTTAVAANHHAIVLFGDNGETSTLITLVVRSCFVTKWRRVGEPIEFKSTSDGADIDIGWSWRVERERSGLRQTRNIRVEVAGGHVHSTDLPPDAARAIQTRGASAVDGVLDEDDPPERLVVSTLGVSVVNET